MATLDGIFLVSVDEDPWNYGPIPKFLCTICGVRLFQDGVGIHTVFHTPTPTLPIPVAVVVE